MVILSPWVLVSAARLLDNARRSFVNEVHFAVRFALTLIVAP